MTPWHDRLPICAVLAGTAALCALAPALTRVARAEATPAELRATIAALAQEIGMTQAPDGSLGGEHRFVVGQTALAVMALRAAGVSANSPTVRKAADYLTRNDPGDNHGVYQTSLRAVALASVNPEAYRQQILACARYLVEAQQKSGGWSYGLKGRTDNSNSQFAVLGLNAAALSGVQIPDSVWQNARKYFRAGQHRDGGWTYQTKGAGASYGSMTCAGLASVYLCNLWLHVSSGRCGVYPDDRPVEFGLLWLAKNFDVTRNPGKGSWHYYYLYALERAGVILAQRYFGGRDWYREGVGYLVTNGRPARPVGEFYDKCFQLLFLGKGNAPLLIHKAQWARGSRPSRTWNRNRFDAKFLVHFIEGQLGQLLDWQIVPLDAPLDRLMAAPILYVSGSGWPQWTDPEVARIKEYVAAGGLMLVEAANGDSAFDRGFRRFVAEQFPGEELDDLPIDHPIYTAYFDIPKMIRPPLLAVKGPCWVSILYSARGLSCPWDVARFSHVNFKLGTNIAAYVVGSEKLKGKLDKPTYYVPQLREDEQRRGAFTLGQVVHEGNWQPHKVAWRTVLQGAHDKAGLEVFTRPLPIKLDEESPFQAHMLYLTGVEALKLSRREKEALVRYVERGGVIFAEAACSSPEFDRSFRKLLEELFPDEALAQIPVGHPLFEMGEELGPVNYSDVLRSKLPGLDRPLLEFIEREGRAVVIYSRYDLSSAIDGHPCHRCPSILEPSAGRIALKIILYGLSS